MGIDAMPSRLTNTLPQVLVIDHSFDFIVEAFQKAHPHPTHQLKWVDGSGNRSVWWWGPPGTDDYDEALDLPLEVFEAFRAYCSAKCTILPVLLMRREDPGLGIYLPEIDAAAARHRRHEALRS